MKKITMIAALFISCTCLAQTSTLTVTKTNEFERAMLANISQLDTASIATLAILANNFERIGNAEKTKWEPFYYAAYCYTSMAFISADKTRMDECADRADKSLQSALACDKNNSEISALAAMILSCRIMVDPMSRFPILIKDVNNLVGKAKEQNASNPRIYLLEARMQVRTPEAFGGGQKIAKQTLETAIQKFEQFVPASKMAPSWGFAQAKSMLDKLNSQ